MYYLLTGAQAFSGYPAEEINTSKEVAKLRIKMGRYEFPKCLLVDPRTLKFMVCCLMNDSDQRPSWKELSNSQYIVLGPQG